MQSHNNTYRIDQLVALLLSDRELTAEQCTAMFDLLDDRSNQKVLGDALDRYYASHPRPAYRVTPDPRRVAEGWRELAEILGLGSGAAKVSKLGRPRLRAIWLRVAAVLLPVALVVGVWFGYESWNLEARNDARLASLAAFTPSHNIAPHADSVRRVELPDGTEVTLNRNATLSYDDGREVKLTGEAWFKVAENPDQPFVIHSEHITVKVLGTEFDFNTYSRDGKSRLSLYDGSVELEHAAGTQRLAAAGKEFTLDTTTGAAVVSDFDPTQRPGWIEEAENVFNFMTFGEIFDLVEKEYGVVITGREITDVNKQLNFVLDKSMSIGDVMSMLEFSHGEFGYAINGRGIVLHRRE